MNNMKTMGIVACMAAVVTLSGCATTGSGTGSNSFGSIMGTPKPESKSETTNAPETTRRKAGAKGFLKGCGMGALIGILSRDAKAAAIACAAGGVMEARVSVAQYDAQVAQARVFQKSTVTVGVITKVETSKVAVETKQADGTTKVEQAEKLDRLYVPMKAERVAAKDPKLADVLKKLGKLAAEDKTGVPMIITIEGPSGQRAWIREQISTQLAGSKVQVLEETAPAFAVEVSPIPSK